MAKTERTPGEATGEAFSDTFDLEAFLATDFATLPPAQTLSGAWILKWISSFVTHGTNDRGTWVAVDVNLDPQVPVGADAEQIISELNMKDLPRIKHRVFVSSLSNQRDFYDNFVSKFGVEKGHLDTMLAEGRGGSVIATLRNGKGRNGKAEVKLSNFREVSDTA